MTHLLDRLRAATEPSRELDALVGRACGVQPKLKPVYRRGHYIGGQPVKLRDKEVWPRYTSSIDAALMLVPEAGDLHKGPCFAWSLYAGWLTDERGADPRQSFRVHAEVGKDGIVTREIRTDRTPHPALALAIAALEARGG